MRTCSSFRINDCNLYSDKPKVGPLRVALKRVQAYPLQANSLRSFRLYNATVELVCPSELVTELFRIPCLAGRDFGLLRQCGRRIPVPHERWWRLIGIEPDQTVTHGYACYWTMWLARPLRMESMLPNLSKAPVPMSFPRGIRRTLTGRADIILTLIS